MTGHEYLSQHRRIAELIKKNQAEYKAILESLDLVGIDYSRDKVQSPVKDIYAETMARAEARLQALKSDLSRLFDIQVEICETIKKIGNPRLELLLTLHYIALMPWESVAEEMDISRTTVYEWRRAALIEIEEIIKRGN